MQSVQSAYAEPELASNNSSDRDSDRSIRRHTLLRTRERASSG